MMSARLETLTFSRGDRAFVLRELRADDVERYLRFFNELGDESIRCRFGHLLTKLTASTAGQRLRADGPGEKAVAVFDVPENRIVAVGRCYPDSSTGDAEVAMVVAEDSRRLGLGRFLLRRLIGIAERENSGAVISYIATRNAPVIALLRSEGFVSRPPEPGQDLRLVLNLAATAGARKA